MLEMVKRGHEVYAIAPDGKYRGLIEEHNIHYITYSINRSSVNPVKELGTIRHLKNTLSGLGLDILHTFMAKPNIYGTIAARQAEIPIVINTVTGLGSYYVGKSIKVKLVRFVIEQAYRFSFKKADCVIFQNEDDMSLYSKKIVDPAKSVLVKGSGIDTGRFSPEALNKNGVDALRRELGFRNKKIVLMIARAIWHKGIKEYYRAADIFTKKYQDWEFVFAGDTDSGNISCASEIFLNSGSVRWLGFRNDVRELLTMCEIYVLPSYYREGLPRTLLEAAAMEKPLVTTDVPGCREVVEDGFNGYLVKPKNAVDLAEKIEKLMLDEYKRITFGRNGREKIKKEFDISLVIDKYLDIYSRYNDI